MAPSRYLSLRSRPAHCTNPPPIEIRSRYFSSSSYTTTDTLRPLADYFQRLLRPSVACVLSFCTLVTTHFAVLFLFSLGTILVAFPRRTRPHDTFGMGQRGPSSDCIEGVQFAVTYSESDGTIHAFLPFVGILVLQSGLFFA